MKTNTKILAGLLILSLVVPYHSVFAKVKRKKPVAVRTEYFIRKSAVTDVVLDTASQKPRIFYNVPFVSQAPTGNWNDAVFKDACEEAVVLMSMAWMMNEPIDPHVAESTLHDIAKWEVKNFGFHQDTSAADTAKIISGYFNFPADVEYYITTSDIVHALENKNIVLVPINGEMFYTSRGPSRHMLVIVGYDYATNKFILHDPVQKNGANLQVDESILAQSLRDYPSGIHKAVLSNYTAMIIIPWPWSSSPP